MKNLSSKVLWIEQIVENSRHPVQKPSSISREENTRKFTTDGAAHSSISALWSNDEAATAISIVSAIPSFFFRLSCHTETEFCRKRSRRCFQGNHSNFEKIILFTFLVNRSSSYWLFHSSDRCLSRREKWFRAKSFCMMYSTYLSSYQSSYIIVLFEVIKQCNYFRVRVILYILL